MAFPECASSQRSLLSASLLHFSSPSPLKTVSSASNMLPRTGNERRPFLILLELCLNHPSCSLEQSFLYVQQHETERLSKIWSVGGQNPTQLVQALPAWISFQACKTNWIRFCLRAALLKLTHVGIFLQSIRSWAGGVVLYLTKVFARFIRAQCSVFWTSSPH